MRTKGQYNKYVLCIMIVLLSSLVLNLNIDTSVPDNSNVYSVIDSFNTLDNIDRPFYYLDFTSKSLLPEEESVAIHFIRTATRYLRYSQRFLYHDLYSSRISPLGVSLFLCLLILFRKQINNISELASHIGGHAPPCWIR